MIISVEAPYSRFATEAERVGFASLYANPLEDIAARLGRPFGYGDAKKVLLEKVNATRSIGTLRLLRGGITASPLSPRSGPWVGILPSQWPFLGLAW